MILTRAEGQLTFNAADLIRPSVNGGMVKTIADVGWISIIIIPDRVLKLGMLGREAPVDLMRPRFSGVANFELLDMFRLHLSVLNIDFI